MESDPLSALADIHLPEQVGIWPLAPGWWVLLLVLAIVLIRALFLAGRYLHRRRLRQAALSELRDCRHQLAGAVGSNASRIDYLNAVNAVLRRVALAHFPRQTVAGLTGRAWLRFLHQHGSLQGLDPQSEQALAEGRFAPDCQFDPDAVQKAAEEWIDSQYSTGIRSGTSLRKTATHHA